jgi:hypothetical protein
MYYPREELYENNGIIFKVVDMKYEPEVGLLFWLFLNTVNLYTHINVEVEDDDKSHYFLNIMIGLKNDQNLGDAVYLQLPTPGAKITEVRTDKFKFTIGKDVKITYELYNENLLLSKTNYRSSLGAKGTFSFKFVSSDKSKSTLKPVSIPNPVLSSNPKKGINFNDQETNNWWKQVLSSSNDLDLDEISSSNGLELLSNICSTLPIDPPQAPQAISKKRNFDDDDDDDEGPPPLRRIDESHNRIQNRPKKIQNISQPPESLREVTPVQNPNAIEIIADLAQLLAQPMQPVQPERLEIEQPIQESLDDMWKEIERKVQNNERDDLDEMWKAIETKIKETKRIL